MCRSGRSGQVASSAAFLLPFLLAAVLGGAEALRVWSVGVRADQAAVVGVLAGLSRRDFATTQATGSPTLFPDAGAVAQTAALQAVQDWPTTLRSVACQQVDARTVRCQVALTVSSPLLRFLGVGNGTVTVTRQRQGVLELQTR